MFLGVVFLLALSTPRVHKHQQTHHKTSLNHFHDLEQLENKPKHHHKVFQVPSWHIDAERSAHHGRHHGETFVPRDWKTGEVVGTRKQHGPRLSSRELESVDCDGVHSKLSLIPLPREMHMTSGCLVLSPTTRVLSTGPLSLSSAHYLASMLGLSPDAVIESAEHKSEKHTIKLRVTEPTSFEDKADSSDPEGYKVTVSSDGVELEGNSAAGLFHAVQTLRQMLNPHFEQPATKSHSHRDMEAISVVLPHGTIVDSPVYSWRGMHLDVSRHFFDVDEVKRFVDLIALHKMNRFHWHLTDDQGWRIPIAKYPKLTETGAWRHQNSTVYGGAYSQEDIRSVVDYAAERFVTVVPEIEMPGHAQAAIASYPELGCPHHKKPDVWTDWGVSQEAFCAGNPHSYHFLEHVLEEVVDVFPSKYVHIGGDECDKTHWTACPLCQQKIEKENLETPEQLQAYFTSHMSKFLAAKERRLVGWDEILEGGLEKGATVMSWRGIDGGVQAAKRGLDAVMTPMDYVYFDRSYKQNDKLGRFGSLPLEKTYNWEPLPEALKEKTAHHILGGQGEAWTEGMQTRQDLEYLTLPRMTALAEVLWTPVQLKSWDGFQQRLVGFSKRFDKMRVDHFTSPNSIDLERDDDQPNVKRWRHHHKTSHIEKKLRRNTSFFTKHFDSLGMPL